MTTISGLKTSTSTFLKTCPAVISPNPLCEKEKMIGSCRLRRNWHLLKLSTTLVRSSRTPNRRELVRDSFDAQRGHGRAFQRRQQHAPHGIADGRAIAALERFNDEAGIAIRGAIVHLHPFRNHELFCNHLFSAFRLWGPPHPHGFRVQGLESRFRGVHMLHAPRTLNTGH